jgi:hypothetical protein
MKMRVHTPASSFGARRTEAAGGEQQRHTKQRRSKKVACTKRGHHTYVTTEEHSHTAIYTHGGRILTALKPSNLIWGHWDRVSLQLCNRERMFRVLAT